ncbi:MAG: hypothetical protein J4432_04680 [DPANN group archaeon]|nr:hypothetical protein [DPANN group archaeon]
MRKFENTRTAILLVLVSAFVGGAFMLFSALVGEPQLQDGENATQDAFGVSNDKMVIRAGTCSFFMIRNNQDLDIDYMEILVNDPNIIIGEILPLKAQEEKKVQVCVGNVSQQVLIKMRAGEAQKTISIEVMK